jgi:LuxR family maltose regulon positive regulatory protein
VIDRRRLRALLGEGPVVAVADGGYGKSVLLRSLATAGSAPAVLVELDRPTGPAELLAALVRSARHDGLSDVAAALTGADPSSPTAIRTALAAVGPLSLIVDEIGRLDPAAAAALAAAAEAVTRPGRMLLGGRELPPELAALPNTTYLDAADLAFTAAETEELLGLLGSSAGPAERDLIQQLTGGWPAAVAVAAVRAAGSAPAAVVTTGTHRGGTAATALPAREDVSGEVRALCCLPLLSEPVGALVAGPLGLGVLADAGIPTLTREDGWFELAEPIRDRLAEPAALSVELRREVARRYAAAAKLAVAVHLLWSAGDQLGALALLSDVHWTALAQVGVPDLRTVIDAVSDDQLLIHPQALISSIRLTEDGPVGDERGRWIDRARRIFPDDHALRPLVDAESGRMAIRLGQADRAVALARAALARPKVLPLARGRAEFVLGMATVYRGDPAGLREGMAHFLESIAALRQAGDRRWEAEAHLTLGFGLDYPAGAISRAAERMREALAVLPQADVLRATYLTFLAEVLLWLPDLGAAEAALLEAESIAARSYDQRLSAYVQWTWAWVACSRGDRVGAGERVAAALRHTDGWFRLASGLAFLGEATEILASVGDEAGARRALADGARRPDAADQPHLLARARAVIAARFDDPAPARDALVAEAQDEDTRPLDRPRLLLLAAWAAHRMGDDELAAADLRASTKAAEAIGHLPAAGIRDPDLAAWAAGLGETASVATPPEIWVLGPLRVSRTGADVTPPPGHPADLVALLAVRGSQPVETVIDVLWPDVDLTTGRSRLRNLLNRIRQVSGDLVERRGPVLQLVEGARCDLATFDAAAAAAMSAAAEQRAGLARQALVRGGDLLPAVDAEWVTSAQRAHRRTVLELLDLVAETSWKAGDLDDSRRHIRQAIDLEPHDEIRYVRLARVLLRQGRRGSAREVVRRALAAAAEIGATPSESLVDLVRQLGRKREPVPVPDAVTA